MTARLNPEAQAALQERANILVVDDLQEKHVVFRTILEELGENIVSARSGKEALRYILEMEFAVILLDVNMPDIDGLETASLIRHYKKSAQTPIVFITAYVDELQAKRGYALGAVDYIPSPVVPEVLRSKVRVFVELHRMNRQLQLRAAEREALARSETARVAAEEAIQRADYLSDVSQRLSRSLNLEHTSRALLDAAAPMLGERAILVLADADGHVTRSMASTGKGLDDLPAGAQEAVGRTLRERQFQLWHDDETDLALAICPLTAGERVRGALLLEGPARQFDGARLALAREVASRASIAMENARLYSAVQEADRRKNEFLAMLAHELRNPLAPIRNAVHIMQGSDVAAPTMHWARDVISRQADHMARLIDDLLDVSRIVQGKVVVKPERLHLASLIERSAESTLPKMESRGQQLRIQLPDEPVVIDGDPVRLAQVLSNLINNAAKFSPQHAVIELAATYEGGMVAITVRDEGAGIDPAFLPHIFDLFAQADQSLDRSQGGLGIGLTLVKHLVELHGGSVEARSEGLGRGAEVTVRLPALLDEQKVTVQPEEGAEAGNAGRGANGPSRILVVDDLVASAETLMTLLEMEGFEVRIANEGMAALKIAQEFRPDVVLLDIGLPGMNGFEVAHKLRELPAGHDALLIALTGYGEAESRSRSAEAGFDFHMVKPADVNLLLQMIADPQQSRSAKVA
ncbi:response regulator [Ramlibacter sp. MMS24-I3-19]|uniref:hybrid sensor histidine kinase/response regulator n=1 Tax=Ramlibacter sp. MMS24-I3-19 TaxID=3416606 RepID=UPI003CFBFA27